MDGLNQTQELQLTLANDNSFNKKVYVSVYNEAKSKVIEFSEIPCTKIIGEQSSNTTKEYNEESKEEEKKDSDTTNIGDEEDDFIVIEKSHANTNRPNLEGKKKTIYKLVLS